MSDELIVAPTVSDAGRLMADNLGLHGDGLPAGLSVARTSPADALSTVLGPTRAELSRLNVDVDEIRFLHAALERWAAGPDRASDVSGRNGFIRTRDGWVGASVHGSLNSSVLDHNLRQARENRWSGEKLARELQCCGIPALAVSGEAGSHRSRREAAHRRRHDDRGTRAPGTFRSPGAPLAGKRVVGLVQLVAGPVACGILEMLGADVTWLPRTAIAGSAPGALVSALEATPDLVVHNLSPIAWSRLTRAVPDLVRLPTVSVRGFNAASTQANWKALGFLVEAHVDIGYVPSSDRQHWVRHADRPVLDLIVGIHCGLAAIRALTRGEAPGHETIVMADTARRIVRSMLPSRNS